MSSRKRIAAAHPEVSIKSVKCFLQECSLCTRNARQDGRPAGRDNTGQDHRMFVFLPVDKLNRYASTSEEKKKKQKLDKKRKQNIDNRQIREKNENKNKTWSGRKKKM